MIILRMLSSVQFSRSVVSDSLRPHESQHAKPPCPSPTPRVLLNPYPLSWWCHSTISSSAVPFSCSQSFPGSEFIQISQLFASGSQIIGVSASTSVLPMNTQNWSSLGWTSQRSNQFCIVRFWRFFTNWKIRALSSLMFAFQRDGS